MKRNRSEADYVRFQQFQAAWIGDFIQKDLTGKEMLDLGCGTGGYSNYFFQFAKKLIAYDFTRPEGLNPKIEFVPQTAGRLPFEDGQFEFVFCASVIEHVKDPQSLLSEMSRVLKKGGRAYVSFPPFYSLNGGHQFKPFHYLPEKWCLWIYNQIHGTSIRSYALCEGEWGLHRLGIDDFRGWIQGAGLNLVRQKTRFTDFPFDRIPLLKNFVCWHVEFLLTK